MNENKNRIPEDMNLSRAVPPMPDTFRRRIQDTCDQLPEKSRRPMWRGSLVAASCFAMAVILFLAVGFNRPGIIPDTTTPLRQATQSPENTQGPGENNSVSDAPIDGNLYYFRDGGNHYHLDSECQGMKNALNGPLSVASLDSRTACPVCIGESSEVAAPVESTPSEPAENTQSEPVESTPSEPLPDNGLTYYYTDTGSHYHLDSDCQQMKSAKRGPRSAASQNGRTACPFCAELVSDPEAPDPEPVYYMTEYGSFFHRMADCTGMKNADTVYARDIILHRRPACPYCIPQMVSDLVLDAESGLMHADDNCEHKGMSERTRYSIYSAPLESAQYCEECAAGMDQQVMISTHGYFHIDSKCDYIFVGNTSEQSRTVKYAEAIAYLYEPCPSCTIEYDPTASTMSEPAEE